MHQPGSRFDQPVDGTGAMAHRAEAGEIDSTAKNLPTPPTSEVSAKHGERRTNLAGSLANSATNRDAKAQGRITNDGGMPRAWIACFGQWSERLSRSRKNRLAKAPVRGRGSFASALLAGLLLGLCAGLLAPATSLAQTTLIKNTGQTPDSAAGTRSVRFKSTSVTSA